MLIPFWYYLVLLSLHSRYNNIPISCMFDSHECHQYFHIIFLIYQTQPVYGCNFLMSLHMMNWSLQKKNIKMYTNIPWLLQARMSFAFQLILILRKSPLPSKKKIYIYITIFHPLYKSLCIFIYCRELSKAVCISFNGKSNSISSLYQRRKYWWLPKPLYEK